MGRVDTRRLVGRGRLGALLLLVGALSSAARADELLVFAAASTTESLQEVATAFTQKTGTTVRFSFGGSSTLARQIANGAPADLFISADEASLDVVQKAKLTAPDARKDLLGNSLVVVVPRDSTLKVTTPRDLVLARRIALADPAAVPAGVYAKAWLEKAGVWQVLKTHLVPTLDVRAALAAAETSAADEAVVYATDARVSTRTKVVFKVAPEATPEIRYGVERLARAKSPSAVAFYDFLGSAPAGAIFAKHGFTVLGTR